MIHIALHFIVPVVIALVFFRSQWKAAFAIMMLTMVVDVDHLLADPVYDPGRCSIGFHPLHRLFIIPLYVLLCFFPKTRLAGLGLTVHMVLDSVDCQFTNGVWFQP